MASTRLPTSFPLGRQNGLFNPVLVVLHLGVDTGNISPATADAEAHDPHLIPLTRFFTYQWTSAVTLKIVNSRLQLCFPKVSHET
jgi:hypothetical protein